MSHTMRFGPFQDHEGLRSPTVDYVFHYDSGLLGGEVEILKTCPPVGDIPGGSTASESVWSVKLPKEVLVEFVAELLRSERHSQLDNQTIAEILGVSRG